MDVSLGEKSKKTICFSSGVQMGVIASEPESDVWKTISVRLDLMNELITMRSLERYVFLY